MTENSADAPPLADILEPVEFSLSPSALEVIDHLRDHQSRSDWLEEAALELARSKADFWPGIQYSWEQIRTRLGQITKRRLVINLLSAEIEEVAELARRSQTSTSKLGQVAIRQLLAKARLGDLSMVRESLAKAELESRLSQVEVTIPTNNARKERPSLLVGLLPNEFEEITQLAHQWRTSASRLGQVALRLLLMQARAGAMPMVKPSTAANADITRPPFRGVLDPLD